MSYDKMGHSFSSSRGSSICLWYTVGRKMSDKNVEQWISIKSCVKTGKSASEMTALMVKKLSVFE
jgi:hypothetical protein